MISGSSKAGHLVLLGFALFIRPAWGEARGPIAVIGMYDSRVARHHFRKADEELRKALHKEASLTPVDPSLVEKGVREVLQKILTEEITAAMDHFYHFRFEEAASLMAGRDDPEALKVKALLAQAEGREKEGREYLIRLFAVEPDPRITSKDYPPQLVRLFEQVKKEGPRGLKGKVPLLKIGDKIYPSEDSLAEWEQRFQKMTVELSWDAILLYRIEPVGWNHKLTIHYFPRSPNRDQPFYSRSVEMIDLDDIDRAAKVLIKGLMEKSL